MVYAHLYFILYKWLDKGSDDNFKYLNWSMTVRQSAISLVYCSSWSAVAVTSSTGHAFLMS